MTAADASTLRAFPARRLLQLIGEKWTPIVIYCLSPGPARLGELGRRIPEISKKMLIQSLKNLERDGIVEKRVFDEVPLRTEYRLTPVGKRLHGPIARLCKWALENETLIDGIYKRRASGSRS